MTKRFTNNSTNYIINCFLLLAVVLSIQSCDKKKQIHSKSTENTTPIYKLVKKAESLQKSFQDDSAIFYFNKALVLCEPKKDYANQYAYILSKVSGILQRTGDYYASESALVKALPYLKYTSRPRFSQIIYTNLANNYYSIYDYDNALLYHEKALKIAISQFRKAQIKCDIGSIYLSQEKYAEAIKILEPLARKKTEDKTDAFNTELQHSYVLYYLGLCYLRVENHKKQALDALNESMEIVLKSKNDFELIGNCHALYLYYKKYENPKLKKYYAMKGYIAACKSNSVVYQINALSQVIEAEDGKDLRKYVERYIKLKDSTIISRKMAKNQFATIIYDSKKDKKENLQLKTNKIENELQLEKEKNRNFISFVIIGFTLISTLILVYFLTLKGKKEKNTATYKSERRISLKLNAELSTHVHQILKFAENNNLEEDKNKEIFLSNLDQIYLKTRNISRENNSIATNEKYASSLKEMISDFKTQNLNLLVNGLDTVKWNKINKIKKIIIYRGLQEFFQNMKKYNDATLVVLSFKIIDKNIVIIYSDNSTKTQNSRIILKNDLQNVENRIKTTNGTINFDNYTENGFKISFTFPL
ncbi:tetratricopeptide (TPR) repeat protein [Flavobacterium sp. HSC-32F16]|uniref:ATP-binding protein n=1 Tax=Flavobacterium sp. HSC-32F16 TaxID=2910964 RepID=UPI0020A438E4|nr:tetratricopeptide repeat-containing sensor histidine kinase [Flavobacterium sp. HSC-32F16]MCP2029379.1 tetratricopeptide (TPR) repeat protein [Flavobacterium sp. HSC-32F16]